MPGGGGGGGGGGGVLPRKFIHPIVIDRFHCHQ